MFSCYFTSYKYKNTLLKSTLVPMRKVHHITY